MIEGHMGAEGRAIAGHLGMEEGSDGGSPSGGGMGMMKGHLDCLGEGKSPGSGGVADGRLPGGGRRKKVDT